MKSCNAKLVIREIPFQTPPYGKIKEYFKANPMHDEGMRLLSKGYRILSAPMDNGKDTEILLRPSRRNAELLDSRLRHPPSYGVKKEQIHVTYNSTDTEALLKEKESVLASPPSFPVRPSPAAHRTAGKMETGRFINRGFPEGSRRLSGSGTGDRGETDRNWTTSDNRQTTCNWQTVSALSEPSMTQRYWAPI